MKKLYLSLIILICILPLSAQIQVVNDITCHSDTNGALIAVPDFGTAPYTYVWSTGGTTQAIHNLGAGLYSVTVTDITPASSVYTFDLTEPLPILITYAAGDITPSTCDGFNNGGINISVSGGVSGYNYLWQELQSDSMYYTEDLSNVRGGNYQITVSDIWNCTVTNFVSIPNIDTISYTSNVESYVCNGLTGAVSIEADQADPAYYFNYTWDTPYETGSFTTNDSIFITSVNLLAGTYTITITDNQTLCNAYFDFDINQSATPMVVSESVIHNVCDYDQFGSISLQVTGGDPKPTYNVTWTGPNGYTAIDVFTISGLISGAYNYTVTDDSVCVTSSTTVIISEDGDCFTLPNFVTPNGDGYNDTYFVEGACNYAEFFIQIYDSWGKLIFTSRDCTAEWDPLSNDAPPNSVYYYLVRLNDGTNEREYKSSIDIKY